MCPADAHGHQGAIGLQCKASRARCCLARTRQRHAVRTEPGDGLAVGVERGEEDVFIAIAAADACHHQAAVRPAHDCLRHFAEGAACVESDATVDAERGVGEPFGFTRTERYPSPPFHTPAYSRGDDAEVGLHQHRERLVLVRAAREVDRRPAVFVETRIERAVRVQADEQEVIAGIVDDADRCTAPASTSLPSGAWATAQISGRSG